MNDMNGKTAIVTGANSGIGLVTATSLAERGAKLTLFCRNETKGKAAVETIASKTGNTPSLILCDFSQAQSINQAADTFLDHNDSLHLLVNNAGAYFPTLKRDARGLEMSISVNHMGYFHLTARLLDCLKATAPARIVSVASRAHTRGAVHFDDLHFKKRRYTGMGAYSASKLMNILFTRELARRVEGSGVTANCLHPGVISTGFAQDEPGVLNRLMKIARPFLMAPEDGAKTTLYLATSTEVDDVSGGYFSACKPKSPTKRAQNDEDAARLWALSDEWMQQ